MKATVFVWIPREIFPGRPPFFGGEPTWVYFSKLKKVKSEKALVKYLQKIAEEYPVTKFKVVKYTWLGRKVDYYYLETVEL